VFSEARYANREAPEDQARKRASERLSHDCRHRFCTSSRFTKWLDTALPRNMNRRRLPQGRINDGGVQGLSCTAASTRKRVRCLGPDAELLVAISGIACDRSRRRRSGRSDPRSWARGPGLDRVVDDERPASDPPSRASLNRLAWPAATPHDPGSTSSMPVIGADGASSGAAALGNRQAMTRRDVAGTP